MLFIYRFTFFFANMYNICHFLYVYNISLQSKHIKIKKNKKNKKTKTKTKAKTKFKKLAYLKKKTQQLNKPKTLFMRHYSWAIGSLFLVVVGLV